MIRINGIIEDIKSLRNDPTYRSALYISNLLQNNKHLFLNKMPETDFNYLLKNFDELSYSSPKDHNTSGFKRNFETYFESLLFHLNKIV